VPIDNQRKIALLRELIAEIPSLEQLNHRDPTFRRWYEKTEGYIKRLFGDCSDQFLHWRRYRFQDLGMRMQEGLTRSDVESYRHDLSEIKIYFESQINEIEVFGDEGMPSENSKAPKSNPRSGGGNVYITMFVGGNVHWGDLYKNAPDFDARQLLNQIEAESRKQNPDKSLVQKLTEQLKEKWPELTLGAAELAMKFLSGGKG